MSKEIHSGCTPAEIVRRRLALAKGIEMKTKAEEFIAWAEMEIARIEGNQSCEASMKNSEPQAA